MIMLKYKRKLQAIHSLVNKAPFWVEFILLMAVIALVVYLEVLVQHSYTLLPICVPWMYDIIGVNFVSILLALIKIFLRKTSEGFWDVWGTYLLKTSLCFILIPALILLPNKYLPSTILVKEKYCRHSGNQRSKGRKPRILFCRWSCACQSHNAGCVDRS